MGWTNKSQAVGRLGGEDAHKPGVFVYLSLDGVEKQHLWQNLEPKFSLVWHDFSLFAPCGLMQGAQNKPTSWSPQTGGCTTDFLLIIEKAFNLDYIKWLQFRGMRLGC